ncbi:MAG TPA: hypothetical protein VH575_05105 [Gemmataceae bacterium]
MEVANWTNCRANFAYDDGALVDLIAPGTGMAEWETFWAALRSGLFALKACRDGESIPLPESAAWIMAEREVASVMVSVMAGTLTANCHFFGGDLELDIDPREVVSESAFESVLALMRFVAGAVGRPVLAVPEGGNSEHAFLSVSPSGQAWFLPPRG